VLRNRSKPDVVFSAFSKLGYTDDDIRVAVQSIPDSGLERSSLNVLAAAYEDTPRAANDLTKFSRHVAACRADSDEPKVEIPILRRAGSKPTDQESGQPFQLCNLNVTLCAQN
jgi:hypothetical protein